MTRMGWMISYHLLHRYLRPGMLVLLFVVRWGVEDHLD